MRARGAFILLELVVFLGILAIVSTALIKSLKGELASSLKDPPSPVNTAVCDIFGADCIFSSRIAENTPFYDITPKP